MSIINLPDSGDEDGEDVQVLGFRKLALRAGIGLFAGLVLSFSLAGTITIGGGEDFELGRSVYQVGTCISDPIQVIPKTSISGGQSLLSQFTVSGVDPVLCEGRTIRILPMDNSSEQGVGIPIIDANSDSVRDQLYVDVFIAGGEFLANPGGTLLGTTDTTLTRTSGSALIRKSSSSVGSTLVEVFSGGQSRTLKSSDTDLDRLSISFQVRIDPPAPISVYGRTNIEVLP